MTEVLSTPLVQTGAILTSRLRVEFAAAHKRFVMFCGPSGAGKSTAKDDCIRHITATTGLPAVDILLPARTSTKDLTVRLYEALHGSSPQLTGNQLTERVIKTLEQRPTFVCFDEAQHLSLQGMEQLTYIWERCKFAGLVVGDTRLRGVLKKNPQLQSRMSLGVRFELPESDALHDIVRTFHPVLQSANKITLARIERCLGGNLRHWRDMAQLWDFNAKKFANTGCSEQQLLELTLADFVR